MAQLISTCTGIRTLPRRGRWKLLIFASLEATQPAPGHGLLKGASILLNHNWIKCAVNLKQQVFFGREKFGQRSRASSVGKPNFKSSYSINIELLNSDSTLQVQETIYLAFVLKQSTLPLLTHSLNHPT